MSIAGTLSTFPLPELLHWASSSRKTGILELERNKIRKSIEFAEGRIVSCSSSDPSSKIGQFLLARGKISRDNLRDALAQQEAEGGTLGDILRKMGLISEEEIEHEIVAKAEENIYSLFDWPDASFRFQDDAARDPYAIEVDVAVEDILFEGIQRHEELERVRRSFPSMGVVLCRTNKPTPPEVQTSPLASRILESINGERTLAEVLLRTHASEYQVIRFLYMLHRGGVVEIVAERVVADPTVPPPLEARSAPADPMIDTQDSSGGHEAAVCVPGPVSEDAPVESRGPVDDAEELQAATRRYPQLSAAIETAAALTRDGDHPSALQVLNRCYRAQPGDGYLRHLIFKAEASYMANLSDHGLSREMIPVPTRSLEEVPQDKLRPTELFLLGHIDGKSDVKSILWVVPMREVDVYLALQQMRDQELIELKTVEAVGAHAEQPSKVLWG